MAKRYTQDELVAFVQVWQTSTCMNQAIERIMACDVHRNPPRGRGSRSSAYHADEQYMRSRAVYLRRKGVRLKRLRSSSEGNVDYAMLQAIAASPLKKPCKC